jgi:hypothetical protein
MSLCCPDRIILTDVDDTILMFSEAFQRWAGQQGYERVRCIHEAGTVEDSLGVSFDDAYPIVIEFLNSPAFGLIEPEPCAAEVLPELYREGYRFVAITACEPSPLTIALRHTNLREAFGFDFEAVHVSGFKTGNGKGPFLEQYRPTLWCEDNWKHAVLGADLGHNSVVFNRALNAGKEDGRITRVGNWHDIRNLLKR